MTLSDLPDLVFLGVVAFIVVFFIWGWARSAPGPERAASLRNAVLVAGAWLLVTATPTLSGLLRPGAAPDARVFLVLVLTVAVAGALSPGGRRLSRGVPLWALVAFQGFRLPLEWVLHRWVDLGVAPPQMTWTGQNPDIVTGVLALASAPLVARWPRLAWVPTMVGLLLLANIGRIVLLSLPGGLQRFPDPILLPYRFPHVWIASVCVAGALVGHILALRALRAADADPRG